MIASISFTKNIEQNLIKINPKMMYNLRLKLILLIFILAYPLLYAQNENPPKLVVGIVVDQMRYDYLTRFADKYSENGFKRMINEGFNFKNNHFSYVPTFTAPGHASVYTGTSPEGHGIIANDWYDKELAQEIYCVQDDEISPIGTQSNAGKKSPHRMKSTSVADMNRLHTQMRGKTIGVAIKDRAAILPAGHTANAAYWFQGKEEGKFISSSFYMDKLPKWVKKFNKSNSAKSYLKEWNTLYDIKDYKESGKDENEFEGTYKGKESATLPYDLKKLRKQNNGFDILMWSPYGNDLTTDFAIAAIEGENLGKDNKTDFLTLSFSSTDLVGHKFGVNSKEIQDTYLRLDKSIEKILSYLDDKVGKGEYTVFLTADHGGGNVPSYLNSLNIPAGYFNTPELEKKLEDFVKNEYDIDGLVQNVSNNQVFLNYKVLQDEKLDNEEVEKKIAKFILNQNKINQVFTRTQLESTSYQDHIGAAVQAGFNQKRSGDIIYVLDPATVSYDKTGSTHGSPNTYDTHVPLLFFGKGIKHGSTSRKSNIKDIAPTISSLLGIAFPNAATGKPLYIMLDK